MKRDSTVTILDGLVSVGLVLIVAVPVAGQSSAFHRLVQANAIAAPLADAVTTLATNRYTHLVELNPWLVQADGTANPARTVLLKSGLATVNLSLLHAARTQKRPLKGIVYGVVLALNAWEWRVAARNYALARGARR